jgi:hypothetical protein
MVVPEASTSPAWPQRQLPAAEKLALFPDQFPGLNHPPRQSTAPMPKSKTTLISTATTPWIGPAL